MATALRTSSSGFAGATFEVDRLEAPEDVLLYHCVAPGNDSDQRLVALSQVRQLAAGLEDEAVRAPRANAARQEVADRVEASTATAESIDGRFDVVLVNILAPVLIELASAVAPSTGSCPSPRPPSASS